MNRGTGLKDLMSALRKVLPQAASAETEQRLIAAFRNRRKNVRRAWSWAGAAAACLILALTWVANRHSRPVAVAAGGPARYATIEPGFVALPYAESDVPMEQAVIVRMKLRPSELGSLGVPVAQRKLSGPINAELLVGQDGVARAVRVIE